ncbi:hypothetical protein DFJ73DRAFT_354226 [Zopfochytrium polystomum]|nr:hypothetical protein DFJ73DRAFT_354226 [Zopfochytrium polystomum]
MIFFFFPFLSLLLLEGGNGPGLIARGCGVAGIRSRWAREASGVGQQPKVKAWLEEMTEAVERERGRESVCESESESEGERVRVRVRVRVKVRVRVREEREQREEAWLSPWVGHGDRRTSLIVFPSSCLYIYFLDFCESRKSLPQIFLRSGWAATPNGTPWKQTQTRSDRMNPNKTMFAVHSATHMCAFSTEK